MFNVDSIVAKWKKRAVTANRKAQEWTDKATNYTKFGNRVRAKFCTMVAALYKKLEAIARAVSNKLESYANRYRAAKAKAAQEKEKAKQLKKEAKQKKALAKQQAKNTTNPTQAQNIAKQVDEVTENIIKQADAYLANVKKMNEDLDFIIEKVQDIDSMSEQDWNEVNKRLDNMIHETHLPNREEIANVVAKALKEGKQLEL